MSIRSILVAFNGTPAAEAALRYAASLARARGAHVLAMLAHSTHEVIPSASRWIPPEARAMLEEVNSGAARAVEARLEAMRAGLGLGEALDFRRVAGKVDQSLAAAARCHDLVVVGRPQGEEDPHLALHPDRIALLSGRPVIVVPEGHDSAARHGRAALAWDGGRAAARALSDGLELLEAEGEVGVLTIGPRGPWPVEDLLAHLARHGVRAVHEDFPETHPVAETILAFCRRRDPSLLIMGAYEHSKFREDLLGGVTETVMRRIAIPVLLSH